MKRNLVIIVLLFACTYANSQIITFSGKNSRNDEPVPIDSILIQNISRDKDTVIKDTYFNLSGISGIGDGTGYSIPYSLEQNYPNSFDEETRFTVNIPKSGFLTISLLNYLGEAITSFSNSISEGKHEFLLSGGFPSGAYFIISSFNNEFKAIKIMKAGSSSNSAAKIECVGKNEFEPMVFEPGDDYQFTGYSYGFTPRVISFKKPHGGESYVFSFLGNKPEIKSIDPNNGCIGTKVTIVGKNFFPDTNMTSVFFDDLKSQVISVKKDTIIARVPDGATINKVKVVCPFDESNGSFRFYVRETLLLNFKPTKASPGDIITINGVYFLPEKEILQVKIGNEVAPVESATDEVIKAIIPNNANSDLVRVQFFSVNVTSKDSLIIPNHRIYSFAPSKGLAGTKVSIQGKNFGFDKNKVKLLFGTIEAEILNIQDTLIETRVPEGMIDKFQYLKLLKDSSEVRSEKQFEVILSRWNFAKARITINLPNCKYELIRFWMSGGGGSKSETIYEAQTLGFDAYNIQQPNCIRDTNSRGDTIVFYNPAYDCGCSFCHSWKLNIVIDTLNYLFRNIIIFYRDGSPGGYPNNDGSWYKQYDYSITAIPYSIDSSSNNIIGYINNNLLASNLKIIDYNVRESYNSLGTSWGVVNGITVLKFVPESYIKIELIPW